MEKNFEYYLEMARAPKFPKKHDIKIIDYSDDKAIQDLIFDFEKNIDAYLDKYDSDRDAGVGYEIPEKFITKLQALNEPEIGSIQEYIQDKYENEGWHEVSVHFDPDNRDWSIDFHKE